MVLGFGKDANHQDHDRNSEDDLTEKGKHNQTSENNVDPGRNLVNPQVLSEDEFIRNSLTYGMPIPTGKTSTWDRRLVPETEKFHQELLKKHKGIIKEHLEDHKARTKEREAVYGQPLPTSVNNYLVGHMMGTGEGESRFDLGRQRGRDVEEPAHHFSFHNPTAHDRLHGAANIVAGKIRMDQDISTRGKAEFQGKTDDGH